mmetsp:Transcript_3217/g.7182  ORF Transcript_3217/g.7182 Transcript_3217/m.7182 type:complete len:221 (-) Transcript_3217:30-692(-)
MALSARAGFIQAVSTHQGRRMLSQRATRVSILLLSLLYVCGDGVACFMRVPFAGHAQITPQTRCTKHMLKAAAPSEQQVYDALQEFDGDFMAPFELLGIDDVEAPRSEVRNAFRKIARKEHPDVSEEPDAEERFRRISLAYDLLMDDGGRAMLMEALERDDVELLEDLQTTVNTLDEGQEEWDERWVEDEFTAVFRVIVIFLLVIGLGFTFYFFGSDENV